MSKIQSTPPTTGFETQKMVPTKKTNGSKGPKTPKPPTGAPTDQVTLSGESKGRKSGMLAQLNALRGLLGAKEGGKGGDPTEFLRNLAETLGQKQ
jgi:hypothetical protein